MKKQQRDYIYERALDMHIKAYIEFIKKTIEFQSDHNQQFQNEVLS
jgi:hypothetical protein